MKRWAELANDYFQAGLDETTASRWEEEIKLTVQGATPAQACEAIRVNMGAQLKRKLSVRDVILWIRQMMPTKSSQLCSCEHCSKGWTAVAKELSDGNFSLEDWSMTTQTAIPCVCKSGGVVMDKVYPNVGSGFDVLRKKAIKQSEHRIELYGKLATKEVAP